MWWRPSGQGLSKHKRGIENKQLNEFYKERKNSKCQKRVSDVNISAVSSRNHSNTSLFNVEFCEVVLTMALADQGSDVSIIPPDSVDAITGMLIKIEKIPWNNPSLQNSWWWRLTASVQLESGRWCTHYSASRCSTHHSLNHWAD